MHIFFRQSEFILGRTFIISTIVSLVILNEWNYFLENNLIFILGIFSGVSFTYLKIRRKIQKPNTRVGAVKIFGLLLLGGVFGFLVLLAILGWGSWLATKAIRMV